MKFNKSKALSIAVTLLGVAGTLLSGIVANNERAELKAELLEELQKTTKES